jgi:hypothetical protein
MAKKKLETEPFTIPAEACPVCGGTGGMHVQRNCAGAAPEAVQALPQPFPGLETEAVNREVTCIGGGPYDGVWRVPAPLPQELSHGRHIYNLSDREVGLYVHRVP